MEKSLGALDIFREKAHNYEQKEEFYFNQRLMSLNSGKGGVMSSTKSQEITRTKRDFEEKMSGNVGQLFLVLQHKFEKRLNVPESYWHTRRILSLGILSAPKLVFVVGQYGRNGSIAWKHPAHFSGLFPRIWHTLPTQTPRESEETRLPSPR
ncbi:MAG: hypothetical protein ACYC4I_02385, partial [Minisyncoccota bacterium]